MLFPKFFLLVFTLVFGILFGGYSQKKVKYKDLFPILQSKDFKTAEPLLLQYLASNQDEANPHFYLGEIITAKLDSTEIFPNSTSYDSLANLAIISYKKAIRLVDDKELRKNDDYYISYNRRDLRTGKFGIKISDVHLDYENKISALDEKISLIDQIYSQKTKTDSLITELNNNVKSLQNQFPNEKAFLLRSKTDDYDKVRNTNKIYGRVKSALDEYFQLQEKLKSSNKDSQLNIEAVNEWSSINPQPINLFEKEIMLKDYQSFLSLLLIKIEDEIIPLKTLLLETDNSIDNLISENQNVADSSEIRELIVPGKLKDQLLELNAGALPLKILAYKSLKNEAQLLQNSAIFPILEDSTNVFQKVKLLQKHKEKFEKIDQMLSLIDKFSNDENKLNYQFYLETFEPSFEGYLDTEMTLTEKKLSVLEDQLVELDQLRKIFIHNTDSIYINKDVAQDFESTSFVTKSEEKEKYLIIAGQKGHAPFIGRAQFNMSVEALHILSDSAQTISLIQVNEKILLNTSLSNQLNQFKLSSFNHQVEPLWSIQYESDSPIASAKEEAGILFLYNEEGEVVKTLDSKGKEIGD